MTRKKTYPVDCVIYGKGNLRFHLYAANNESKALKSAVTIYHYNLKGLKAPSGIVFDPDNELAKGTRNQAGDIADKTFSWDSMLHLKQKFSNIQYIKKHLETHSHKF
jgi:hypothetical protein